MIKNSKLLIKNQQGEVSSKLLEASTMSETGNMYESTVINSQTIRNKWSFIKELTINTYFGLTPIYF